MQAHATDATIIVQFTTTCNSGTQVLHNRHFYRYGGHIELIRFKEYYRMGRGHERLFPEKYSMKDHISNTKLEKGNHYYIQTQHKDLFFHYNLILGKL